ncbi:PspC domain-containing protein [Salinibacterium sp. SYSU T00001]|uniref:ATP-binding protein n=1 Tax=Homoserinimonas sedimenticola TaxID=2986805 RepID=UPI002236A878|nr:ATP-binding protein [Salinibacterium sedimenticola]MCW4385264.1 PspC domain-containing protein [Salinibacterium sedimenticola]
MIETPAASARPPLVRPRRAVLGGVCAGLSEHLGWPVARVRLIMVIATILGGAGLLFYGWLWALVPLDEADEPARRRAPVAAVLLALGAVAAVAAVVQANITGTAPTAITLALVLTGGAVAWSLAFDDSDPLRSARYSLVVRVVGAAMLLATGLLLLASGNWRPEAMTAVFAIGMIVLGMGVAVAPFVVRLWNELMRERSGRIREEQRAEIAAHLHDSVLQTLALIQNRAGTSSDVARIARAQERELREWLFAGEGAPGADLARELREVAATIEVEYPARIDVVTVGESVPAPPPLVAAAREAMLNAARHGGGEVSVYVEAAASVIDVFIRDRGPGIDLDDLPDDRFGVRESIIGRMHRAGGSANVHRGAGGVGTEVHLHLDL